MADLYWLQADSQQLAQSPFERSPSGQSWPETEWETQTDAATRHRQLERWQECQNQRPLTQKQIGRSASFPRSQERLRDKVLRSRQLRGCDLVKTKIGDAVAGAEIRNRATVIQQKTNRLQFDLTADVRATLLAWIERRGGSTGDYCSRAVRITPAIWARDCMRVWLMNWTAKGRIRDAFAAPNGGYDLSCHRQYRAIQILLGHTKIENTVRYLGVDVEDALLLAERTEI